MMRVYGGPGIKMNSVLRTMVISGNRKERKVDTFVRGEGFTRRKKFDVFKEEKSSLE